MANQSSFTEQEWETVRNTPHAVAMAMMTSDGSGFFGSMREAFTVGKVFFDSAQDVNELIRTISAEQNIQDFTEYLKSHTSGMGSDEAKAWLKALALDGCRQATGIVSEKAGSEDAATYRDWILKLADNVANAATEGGFLGIGGERVSDPEKALLEEIRTALRSSGTVSSSSTASV